MRETYYYIQEPHEEIQKKTIPQYLNRDFFNIKKQEKENKQVSQLLFVK